MLSKLFNKALPVCCAAARSIIASKCTVRLCVVQMWLPRKFFRNTRVYCVHECVCVCVQNVFWILWRAQLFLSVALCCKVFFFPRAVTMKVTQAMPYTSSQCTTSSRSHLTSCQRYSYARDKCCESTLVDVNRCTQFQGGVELCGLCHGLEEAFSTVPQSVRMLIPWFFSILCSKMCLRGAKVSAAVPCT